MKVPQVPPAPHFVFLFVTVFSMSSWAQSSQGRKLLLANPSSESFGTVQVGSSKTLTETVTNSGSQSITISQISANGSAFKVQGFSLPLVLSGGQSYTLIVVYTPASAVSSSGSVAVLSDAANPTLSVPLSGSGSLAGVVTATPINLSFGNVLVGSSKSLGMSLTASGTSVTISGASSTNSEFTIAGITLPVTIAAGQSRAFNAVFTAQVSGAASGTLKFSSNATNSPAVEAVSGTGATTQPHNVTLSWKPASSVATGYNVYRSTVSGGPYTKVNPVLNSSTTYVDNSVSGGKTYYYVTTAVFSSGESKYSNQAAAAVPGH
jgi:hypothetical protein